MRATIPGVASCVVNRQDCSTLAIEADLRNRRLTVRAASWHGGRVGTEENLGAFRLQLARCRLSVVPTHHPVLMFADPRTGWKVMRPKMIPPTAHCDAVLNGTDVDLLRHYILLPNKAPP